MGDFGRDATEGLKTEGLNNGITQIHGVLKSTREFGKEQKLVEHSIVTAASDPYSYPTTYPVIADRMLGPIGVELQVTCRIQTWRQRGFWNMSLWAVE